MRKVCSRCGESKPVPMFGKETANKQDGLARWCKPCKKEYQKEYNAKNKERLRANAKEYRAENREKLLAERRAYYQANKERLRAHSKKYREKNIERVSAKDKAYYHANKEAIAEKIKKYRSKHKDRYAASIKAWRDANKEHIAAYNQQDHIKERNRQKAKNLYHLDPEKFIERTRKWREANPEKVQENNRAWRKNNPDKGRHKSAMRRAAKIQRTPCWLTEDDKVLIQRKYTLAQKKTESTGERWVVDHILPLRGKLVSGLHVPSNLRVIKETTNARKHNKFVPV